MPLCGALKTLMRRNSSSLFTSIPSGACPIVQTPPGKVSATHEPFTTSAENSHCGGRGPLLGPTSSSSTERVGSAATQLKMPKTRETVVWERQSSMAASSQTGTGWEATEKRRAGKGMLIFLQRLNGGMMGRDTFAMHSIRTEGKHCKTYNIWAPAALPSVSPRKPQHKPRKTQCGCIAHGAPHRLFGLFGLFDLSTAAGCPPATGDRPGCRPRISQTMARLTCSTEQEKLETSVQFNTTNLWQTLQMSKDRPCPNTPASLEPDPATARHLTVETCGPRWFHCHTF